MQRYRRQQSKKEQAKANDFSSMRILKNVKQDGLFMN